MKSFLSMLTVSAFGLAVVSGAAAQTTRPSTDQPARDTQRDDKQRQAWTPKTGSIESGKLIGMKVRDSQGKDVGEVDQLIVDESDGKITHAVLGKGGVLGIGEQKLVVDWEKLNVQRDAKNRNNWVATVDQATLDSAQLYVERDRDRTPAASPATTPRSDRGMKNGAGTTDKDDTGTKK
jgi:sporulation protein YlmC with PRC-barrel domain